MSENSPKRRPIEIPERCPVCQSPHMTYARHVPTLEGDTLLALYYCMECESFFNPTGNTEPPKDESLQADLEFHIRAIERKEEYAKRLFKEMKAALSEAESMVEIGCGIGAMLSVARGYFPRARGYDINPHAVEYGKKRFGLDLWPELWTPEKSEPYDIILSNHVLEHIEEPRLLFEQMATAAKQWNAWIYLSMPLLNRGRWHYIQDPDPERSGTPFFNNKAHVTHFSQRGVLRLAQEFGATFVRQVSKDLPGFLVCFNPALGKRSWLARKAEGALWRLSHTAKFRNLLDDLS